MSLVLAVDVDVDQNSTSHVQHHNVPGVHSAMVMLGATRSWRGGPWLPAHSRASRRQKPQHDMLASLITPSVL
jgi:hypothetical protein